MADQTDIQIAIETGAQKPASVSTPAGSVTMPSAADKIAADLHVEANKAVKTKRRGLRFSKLVPPGAT